MRIKIYRDINLYITNNRMIGFGLLYFSLLVAMYYAFFIEGASGRFIYFVHFPTWGSVGGVGISITYMKIHMVKDNELGIELRKNLIFSGWITFFVKLVFIGNQMYTEEIRDMKNLGPLFAEAMLALHYGYINGIIFETFFTRDIRNEKV